MVLFVTAILIAVMAIVLFCVTHKVLSLLAGVFIAAVLLVFSGLYSQDVGETVVIRSLGGEIVGTTIDSGFHWKSPWQDAIKYDTRNNVVSFVSDGKEDYFGGSANGPHVTVNDSGGAQADIDIQVNYSLDPNVAEELYRNYGTQESFVQKVVALDVRSIPREVAGQFATVDILTNRGEFSRAIHDALEEKWADLGLIVEQVSVQQVRYPDAIVSKYSEAQAADVEKQRAQAEQERAKIEAETKVIIAQGEADANAVLAESLTEEVLQSMYYETLAQLGKSGNLVVITDGSGAQPLIDVTQN